MTPERKAALRGRARLLGEVELTEALDAAERRAEGLTKALEAMGASPAPAGGGK